MRIWASALQCRRGEREVFCDLSFSLDAGDALQITGRNGSGKSSLLRIVAGLLPAAGGAIGCEGGAEETPLAEQAHYVGHLDAIKPSLTVAENLGFWTRFLGGTDDAIAVALDTLGLGTLAEFPAAYLSAGQRRRLSLARLLTVTRPLWLLDEPTTALDASGQARLAALMQAHRAQGGLIMAATHTPIGLEAPRQLRLGPPADRAGIEATPEEHAP
jgi:heme exporter protein A